MTRHGANGLLHPRVCVRRYLAACSNQKAKQGSSNERAIDQEATRALSTPLNQIHGWSGPEQYGRNAIFLDRHHVRCGANEAITFFHLRSAPRSRVLWLSYGMVIALKGGRGKRYCSSCSADKCKGHNNHVQCNRDKIWSNWERWKVLDGGDGKVMIQGMAQKLNWKDLPDGNLLPRSSLQNNENKFIVQDLGYPLIAFKGGLNNKYCRDAHDTKGVRCDAPHVKSRNVHCGGRIRRHS